MYRFLQIGIFHKWLRQREIKFNLCKYIFNVYRNYSKLKFQEDEIILF